MTDQKKYSGVWKKFFSMLKKAKLPYVQMAIALAIIIVATIFSLQQPKYLAEVIGGKYDYQSVFILLGVALGQYVFTAIGNYVKKIAQAHVDKNMQEMTLKKILRIPVSKLEGGDANRLISRATLDTTLVSAMLLELVVTELPRIFYMVSSAIILYTQYNKTLAYSTLVTIPITLIGSFIAGKLVFGRADRQQTQIAVVTARMAEKIVNLPLIKSYGRENEESAAGQAELENLAKARKKKVWADIINNCISSIGQFLPNLFLVCVGATLFLRGEITVAIFIAFYQYAITFCSYVTAHLALWAVVKTAQGAVYRLSDILETEEENFEGITEPIHGDIVFDHVSFSYGDRKVLNDISFTIEQGKKTVFLGYSGSGKTTALNLVEQFYLPDEGQILIQGKDIRQWKTDAYRKNFTYLSQNAPTISGTVRDVVTYGLDGNYSDDDIMKALSFAGAAKMVRSMGGLDCDVGIGGSKLSVGQKQKLSVARSFISSNQYILLDEATSALDFESTKRVNRVISEEMKGKTILLVAHDLRLAEDADKIIVFSDGRILDQGTHEELMKRCAHYEELVRIQAQEDFVA